MFIALLIIWIIFNGKFTLEILLIGIVLSLLLTLFVKKFLFKEKVSVKNLFRNALLMVEYFLILIVEIIKANIWTLSTVLNKKLQIEPALCTFKPDIKDKNFRVLLADSITLTPGTITVDLSDDGVYTVHCIDKTLGEDLNKLVFIDLIKKMEAE